MRSRISRVAPFGIRTGITCTTAGASAGAVAFMVETRAGSLSAGRAGSAAGIRTAALPDLAATVSGMGEG